MIFRQFCTSDEQISYLLADPVRREAAIVDPHAQAAHDYVEVIRRLDLRLVYVIETHLHESHRSAAAVLRNGSGARLVTHSKVDMACVDMHVDDNDSLFVGEELIRVIATPGHSTCSLSYLWRDRLFSGHTLLAGQTGPCERPDADASLLFDSVQRLFELPDETLVFPGRVMGQRRLSSIGQERAMNTDLQSGISRERYVRRKQLEALYARSWSPGNLAINKECKELV